MSFKDFDGKSLKSLPEAALCWMFIGMVQSQNVHLKGFGTYVVSHAQIAQSHQRRF
jgi:hypothetical protein